MSVSMSTLSDKRQNKTIKNKKKPLKTVKYILSTHKALHWPLIDNKDERSKLLNLFDEIVIIDANDDKTINKIKQNVKFGVNEISRIMISNNCDAVLVDNSVPRILINHILTLAIAKKIPLICLNALNDLIKSKFGFKSSTICFINNNNTVYKNISKYIKYLCLENFPNIYRNDIDIIKPNVIAKNKELITGELNDTINVNSVNEELNIIKIVNDEKTIKEKKGKIKFQSVFIRKMHINTNKKNKVY